MLANRKVALPSPHDLTTTPDQISTKSCAAGVRVYSKTSGRTWRCGWTTPIITPSLLIQSPVSGPSSSKCDLLRNWMVGKIQEDFSPVPPHLGIFPKKTV